MSKIVNTSFASQVQDPYLTEKVDLQKYLMNQGEAKIIFNDNVINKIKYNSPKIGDYDCLVRFEKKLSQRFTHEFQLKVFTRAQTSLHIGLIECTNIDPRWISIAKDSVSVDVRKHNGHVNLDTKTEQFPLNGNDLLRVIQNGRQKIVQFQKNNLCIGQASTRHFKKEPVLAIFMWDCNQSLELLSQDQEDE